jgi:hypothetical protein
MKHEQQMTWRMEKKTVDWSNWTECGRLKPAINLTPVYKLDNVGPETRTILYKRLECVDYRGRAKYGEGLLSPDANGEQGLEVTGTR